MTEKAVVKGRAAHKLFLAAVALIIALGAVECAVRITGLAPVVVRVEKGRYRLSRNPLIGYEPIPAMQYDGKSLHYYDYRGASNSLGYRDREHAVKKPPGTYRIVVLGDSIAAGHYVDRFEDTFPAVLERGLAGGKLQAEVLSFGVSGYNTRQEVETLKERGLAFDPDLVIVAYCLNDRERNDGGILATLVNTARGSGGFEPERSFLAQSALFRLIWYSVLKKHKEPPAAYRTLEGDTVTASFAELAGLVKTHGFQVLVAVFPDLGDLGQYAFDDQHAFVAAQAAQLGFERVDLLDAFRSCGGDLAHDRYHPSTKGHQCAGEAIARAVSQLMEKSAR